MSQFCGSFGALRSRSCVTSAADAGIAIAARPIDDKAASTAVGIAILDMSPLLVFFRMRLVFDLEPRTVLVSTGITVTGWTGSGSRLARGALRAMTIDRPADTDAPVAVAPTALPQSVRVR